MELTVASTTSTQAELDHSASDNWREPMGESAPTPTPDAPASEPGAGEAGAGEGADAAEADPAAEEAPRALSKNGWQKRVDKLTRRNAALEERIAALEAAKPSNGERRPTAESAPAAAPKKPSPEQFQTDEEYLDALTDWKIEQRLAAREATERQQTENARTKEVFAGYNRAVSEARGRHDDFDEVVGREDIQIPASAQVAIIESGVGPEIAYFLGKNPDRARKLCEMSPAAAAVEVGRIAASLDPAKPDSQPRRHAARPAAPITPVAARTAGSTASPDTMSMADYRRARSAGTI